MEEALQTTLDKAREKFQTERAALRDNDIPEQERKRRADNVRDEEHNFWESLGDEGQEQVRQRIRELEPDVLPIHPRPLGAIAPVPTEWGVLDEYYFLRRLAEGE